MLAKTSRMASLIAFVLVAAGAAGDSGVARTVTEEQWQADIEQYRQLLVDTHLDPFHAIDEIDFNRQISELKSRLSELRDDEVALELIRIASLVGDGHTWLTFGERIAPERVPLSVYEFSDGVYVVGAMPGFESHVGAEVVSVGGRPVTELLIEAERYCARDNEWTVLSGRASWLTVSTFLVRHRAALHGAAPALRLRYPDGADRTVEFPLYAFADYLQWRHSHVSPPDSDLPLYRRQPDKTYWMEYLPDHDALYVKFNAVQNLPGGPHLVGFSVEMLERVEQEKAKRLIIDVRDNGGGNGDLLNPMVRRISENKRINREGRLFVITGRETFSAALMFTARMERATEALFAGEPGAGKPNSYGEFNRVDLTHSKMHGSVSSRWHEEGTPDDTREFIPVDIPAPLSSADFFSGRDPVLEAVLAYRD